MSAWTWVLAALCITGAALALASIVSVLIAALRLRAKIADVKRRPLFLSLESLRIQQSRLTKMGSDVAPVIKRAQAAVTSLRDSMRHTGLTESRGALEESGAELRALYDDLR
jgi:hypothetical protein